MATTFNRGELQLRIQKNRERLSAPTYRNPAVFTQNGEWYGDWQGRCLLALCSLYNAIETQSEKENVFQQLQEIIDNLDGHINADGYFGPVFNGKCAEEQQIAGNSWYLRGLCEYYSISGDKKILGYLEKITETFLLPLEDFYRHYPLVKREDGAMAGHSIQEMVSGWILSSDVGCAFIMLDGLTATYAVTKDPRLEKMISTLITEFLKIDLVAMKCQTHASLSCCRGIIRFYQLTNNKKFLDYATRLFDLYISVGMTIDYSNINWFGRPDSWTEPCAIVDSFIISSKLYTFTRDYRYLKLANRIYHTAIRSAQRSNGGAGCNTCVCGEGNNELKVAIYEAFFCCTMRLAEGLKEISDFQAAIVDDAILIALQGSFRKEFGDGSAIDCDFVNQLKGTAHINVKNASQSFIRIYIPGGCKISGKKPYQVRNNFLIFSINGNQEFVFDYELTPYSEIIQGREVYFIGDTMLTKKSSLLTGKHQIVADNKIYTPIASGLEMDTESEKSLVQYIY